MTTTPILGITHVAAAQNNKYLTVNTALDSIEAAALDNLSVVCTAGGNIAVTAATLKANAMLYLTGTPAGAFNLDLGAVDRWVLIFNSTGQTATIRAGTPSVTQSLANNSMGLFVIDGNNVYTLASSGGSYADENARDAIAAMIAAGTQQGLSVVHDDTANSLSFSVIATNTDYQESVRVAADANITLSGEYTLQSIALVDGDRVLATAQSAGADNRIWIVRVGAWDIAEGWDTPDTIMTSTQVPVDEGAYEGSVFRLTTSGTITLGTTALTWLEQAASAAAFFVNKNKGSASYTLLTNDNGKWIYMTRNGAQAFTLEEYAVQPMPNGAAFVVQWFGGSSVSKTVVADAAVSINGTLGATITLSTRYDAWLFKQKARNVWVAVPWAASSGGGGGFTQEQIADFIGAMVTGNTETGITVTYDDTNEKFDFAISDEYIQDLIGAMVAGNTETRVTVTYDDTNGKLDFVVAKDRQVWEYAISDEGTAITSGTDKLTVRAPFAGTIADIKASLSTAGSSGTTIDVNLNGSTIMTTNKLNFDASEKTTRSYSGTAATLTTTAVAEDDELTFDIDTAGTGAKGAKVYIYVDPT